MNVIDVNVLVALFRPEHALHATARAWWSDSGRFEPLTVPDVVWSGFARTVTNPRVFDPAATTDEAWSYVRWMTSQPMYRRYLDLFETMRHFERLCREVSATGNLVSDAYLAACATSLGGTVVTFDRDYRKFDGLRVLELSA